MAHRDLKPENLLLDADEVLKVSDFGLSNFTMGAEDAGASTRASMLHTTCGTPNYVAPEVLADHGYDGCHADVWSCGVILYVLLAGFLPFDEDTMAELFRKIQRAEFAYPSWFTPQVRDLLDRILVTDPAARIYIPEIKAHPWFAEGMDSPVPLVHAPVPISVTPSGEGRAIGVAEEEEEEGMGEEEEEEAAAMREGFNAFDIVNLIGGLALDRLFTFKEFTGRQSKFITRLSMSEALSKVSSLLEEQGFAKVEEKLHKVKLEAIKETRGVMRITVLAKTILSPSLHLVEISKAAGDIFGYNQVLASMQEELVALLASAGAGAGAEGK